MSSPKPKPINNIDFSNLDGILKPVKQRKKVVPQSVDEKPSEHIDPGNAKLSKTARSFEKLTERSTAALKRQRDDLESRVLQAVLPFWDDDSRGVPNPFIRSGLFGVGTNVTREYIPSLPIASLSNYVVTYTGADLGQDDLSVWMSLINLARNQPMTDSIFFTGYKIIKDLGWRMHSDTYKRVQESIQRLKVTGLEISGANQDHGYSGSLIREYGWAAKDASGNAKWMVKFEPRISILFMEDTTTLLAWKTRKKIGSRAVLAQWLHSFYSSHREPLPMRVEKLFELCRSGDSLSSYRRNIKNAFTKLVDVGFLSSFQIVGDTIHVQKLVRPKLVISN